MKIGTLNEKQESKYNELMDRLHELEANKHVMTEEEEKEKIKAYMESNKARSKQRYERCKNENK